MEVAGANSNKLQKEMALLEKLDLAVDKNASEMCGRVGLGTSNIMSMACELLLHKEAEGENKYQMISSVYLNIKMLKCKYQIQK